MISTIFFHATALKTENNWEVFRSLILSARLPVLSNVYVSRMVLLNLNENAFYCCKSDNNIYSPYNYTKLNPSILPFLVFKTTDYWCHSCYGIRNSPLLSRSEIRCVVHCRRKSILWVRLSHSVNP